MSDPKTPNAAQSLTDIVRGMVKNYPQIIDLVNQSVAPTAQAQLGADTSVAPGYAQLNQDLLKNYGPETNRIGSEISGQNELASARNDAATLAGPGRDVTTNALANAQIADPEYYQARQLGGNKLAELFGSLDLQPGLSGSERREVGGSLARDNAAAGTSDVPTTTGTVSNAMQFGQAGANRMAQKQDAFGKALSQVTSFLPNAKSGVDTFKQATGKAGMPNAGEGFNTPFSGATGQNAFNLASNTLGQAGNLQNTAITNNAQRRGALDVVGALPDY